MEWVAKITTVALEMMLPAVGGRFLDQHFRTNYWALVGLVLGMTVGMWHLLQMTQSKKRPGRSPTNPGDSDRGSAGSPGD
jgi:Putative F0F1-ATPase subunit (ATPase_gene1).